MFESCRAFRRLGCFCLSDRSVLLCWFWCFSKCFKDTAGGTFACAYHELMLLFMGFAATRTGHLRLSWMHVYDSGSYRKFSCMLCESETDGI